MDMESIMWYYVLSFAAVLLLLAVICLLRSAYERSHLVTTVYEAGTGKLGKEWDGYTFCFLTDLHKNTFGNKGLTYLEERVDALSPDCILIGGDMMCTRLSNIMDFSENEAFIRRLAEKYRVIYALGNHEKRLWAYREDLFLPYFKRLKDCGVEWLVNESVELTRGDAQDAGKICITGLDLDWCYYVSKVKAMPMVPRYMERTLGTPDREQFQILLSHSPIYMEEYAAWGADLTLAGHFHGGTIRLPWIGGVMTPQYQFFFGRDRGRYPMEGGETIVSGGLGTHSIDIRLNNMSELVAVKIRSKQ